MNANKLSKSKLFKRLIDILISVILIIIAFFPMAIISITILLKMGRPILFRQQRPGLYGKTFTMVKFRTMMCEYDGDTSILSDKARVTPLGKFLRNTSLDELPELWNVLKGDMSLVGPRPLLKEYLLLYTQEQSRRHLVKPGITGWAQINGRNAISWEEKFAHDIWYVDNCNLMLDFKILWKTIFAVLKRDGISVEGSVSMPPFRGLDTKERK